eukprot:TRINITY_DN17174_c0_g1_i1.p1 TRINITY_DN17174_c0_g1~~TRINITY_DN17174_c0_g1_i1.p1  ORF type:complete len:210 (+),score=31.21 TRINITY_DN17174_c0_g1_i1:41-670(+)
MARNLDFREPRGDEIKLKIGIVGETGVGKTCCLVRWIEDDFIEANDKYTIGVDYKYKSVTSKEGNHVRLQVHDTAGQERFRTVTETFYRGSHGIVLVYNICDPDSFANLGRWYDEIRGYTSQNTVVVLLGNKTDLDSKRAINYADAKAFADERKISYWETSAKAGTNLDEAFMDLVEQILKSRYVPARKMGLPEESSSNQKHRKFCAII